MRHTAIALVRLDAHVGAHLELIARALLLHLAFYAEGTDYRDFEEERLAAAALERFGPECQAAIPALLDGLRHEPPVQQYAASTLVRLRPRPEQVVPALQHILQEQCQLHNEPDGDGHYTCGIAWALNTLSRRGGRGTTPPHEPVPLGGAS
jgi:hypothetical protein